MRKWEEIAAGKTGSLKIDDFDKIGLAAAPPFVTRHNLKTEQQIWPYVFATQQN